MIDGNKTKLVLSDRRLHTFKIASLLAFSVILLLVTMLLLFVATGLFLPDVPWLKLLHKLAEKFSSIGLLQSLLNNVSFVISSGVVLGQFYYIGRAQRLERLTLTPDGIQYVSPLPTILKRFKPDWYLAWNQVSKVELGTLNGRLNNPDFALMMFTSLTDKRRIQPCLWIDSKNYSKPVSRFAFSFSPIKQSRDEIIKVVMESEVARYISRNVPHITLDTNLSQATVQTSLEKNPHGRISMAIIFLLITYAVIDLMMGTEIYLDTSSSHADIFIISGVVGAALSAIWLYKSTLVIAEKVGLALLIGTLVAAAMYPGALRINAITDSKGPAAYDYYVMQDSDGVILRPVDVRMPSIDYFAHNKFWDKFGKDDIYQVQIRKGGLGFYQFNVSAIVEEINSVDGK